MMYPDTCKTKKWLMCCKDEDPIDDLPESVSWPKTSFLADGSHEPTSGRSMGVHGQRNGCDRDRGIMRKKRSELGGRASTSRWLEAVLDLGDFIPVLRLFDLQGYERRMRNLRDLQDEFVGRIISEHRRKRKNVWKLVQTTITRTTYIVDVLLEHTGTKDGIRITENN